MKVFTAKYPGSCKFCGKPFKAGEELQYRPLNGKKVIACSTGPCTESAPSHYCATCGHELGLETR